MAEFIITCHGHTVDDGEEFESRTCDQNTIQIKAHDLPQPWL